MVLSSFNIAVRSEKDDKRIPVSVASDVMADVQHLLAHIGGSLVSAEMGYQDGMDAELAGRFTLYVDPKGGISFSSAGKGQSGLMDRTVALLETTLEKMGSGSGTYWMEDTYKDARYRCLVLDDLVRLSKHLAPENGYRLSFKKDGNEIAFNPVDIEKANAFLSGAGKMSKGTVHGILYSVQTKRGAPMYGFVVGDNRIKISFRSKEAENDASKYVNGAVSITGTLRYSNDGELIDMANIDSVGPFEKKAFTHMISADRDIPLTGSLEADVKYNRDNSEWKLTFSDLGISSSHQHWDAAVTEFHDYFVFLCDNYLTKDDTELSEEEKEVKGLLRTFVTGRE
jgi:hypothetical protein